MPRRAYPLSVWFIVVSGGAWRCNLLHARLAGHARHAGVVSGRSRLALFDARCPCHVVSCLATMHIETANRLPLLPLPPRSTRQARALIRPSAALMHIAEANRYPIPSPGTAPAGAHSLSPPRRSGRSVAWWSRSRGRPGAARLLILAHVGRRCMAVRLDATGDLLPHLGLGEDDGATGAGPRLPA